MRFSLVKWLAVLIALLLCSMGLAAQQVDQQPYQIQESVCDWVKPLISPLVDSSNKGSATSFHYTASITTSIDTYASLWNYRSAIKAGGSAEEPFSFVDSMISGTPDPDLNWANRDGVAIQLLLDQSSPGRSTALLARLDDDIASKIKSGTASQLDIRTIAMANLLAKSSIPANIANELNIEELAYKPDSSVFDNTDSMFLAQVLETESALRTYPIDYLNQTLKAILIEAPSGIYTSIFYAVMKRAPELFAAHSREIATFVNQLHIQNGGFAMQPGGEFEPQVTFNAIALGANAASVVHSKNYSEMKYPKHWIKRMGKISGGTSVLAVVLMNGCTNRAIKKNSEGGDAGLQECISQNFGDFNLNDFLNSQPNTLVRNARMRVLAKICGIPSWVSTTNEPVAETGEASNIRANLARKIMANNLDISTFTQDGHPLKTTNGCRYSNSKFALEADLFSTSICLTSGGLTTKESVASRTFFGAQIGEAGLSSIEAILWYAVLLNGESDLGELLVLN